MSHLDRTDLRIQREHARPLPAFAALSRNQDKVRYKRLSEEAAVKEGVFWTRMTRGL